MVLAKALPITLLASVASAYDGFGEFFTGGIVDNSPPWSISTAAFQTALSQPNATGQFQITGYNLSSTGSSPAQSRDWTLRVALKADVPLNSSTDSDLTAEDKQRRTQLTVLSVDAPEPSIINNAVDAYRLCALVWPGLNDEATRNGQNDDGTCATALPSQCVTDLEKAAADANSDKSESCTAPSIPQSCRGSFPQTQSSVAFELTKEILGGNRFYALGSQPTGFENQTQWDRAVTNVWPVIFAWSHQQGTGAKNTTADLRCLRAQNIMSGSRIPATVPEREDPSPLNPPTPTAGGNPPSPSQSQPGAGARTVASVGGLFAALVAAFMLL